jgi:lambda family phage portal protein
MSTKEGDEQFVYANTSVLFPNFEGAATNYRAGLRGILSGEADTLAGNELRFLQNRSKHICSNNGYGKIALKNWVTNANYIKVVWKDKKGKSHKVMQSYWDEFAANPSYDGFGDIRTFQGVSNSSIFLTGNSYIRKLIVREGNSNTVPLKLQLIPSILHDVRYSLSSSDITKIVRHGMTFNKSIPTEYHFTKSFLENLDIANAQVQHITVPAEEIIHTFQRDEPGQWLGIPILAPVIMSMYALDDLLTSTVNKQLATQNIAIIVEQAANAISMLPVGTPKSVDDGTGTGQSKIIFDNNANESQVVTLAKGETAKSFQGTDIGANFGVLLESELRKIATVADALYHQLTGDTSGLNYSSLLGMAVQSRNRLEWLHNFLFIPLREKPIAEYFQELAVLYNSKCASAVPYFQLPRWRGVDDLKDNQADLLAMQYGMDTQVNVLAERGLTREDILADLEERKEFEAYGIFLNSAGGADSMKQTTNTQANSNSTGN